MNKNEIITSILTIRKEIKKVERRLDKFYTASNLRKLTKEQLGDLETDSSLELYDIDG